eukprot:COSAG02_NODE_192_length_29942_cov_34.627228_22_plen_342_part_00
MHPHMGDGGDGQDGDEMTRGHAARVIQACRRGQLERRRVLALLEARDAVLEEQKKVRGGARRAKVTSGRAKTPARSEASAQLHVRRTRAGNISDRARRAAAVAEARREAAKAQPVDAEVPLEELLDAACLELRGWARSCPGLGDGDVGVLLAECERSASDSLLGVTVAQLRELSLHTPTHSELTSLLQECEHAVLSRRHRASAAPAESVALLDTMGELQALCDSRPDDEALALLMQECSAEADRREVLSRQVTLGDVAATEIQIGELVAQATTPHAGQAIEQLRGLREECRREVKSQKKASRQRQRPSATGLHGDASQTFIRTPPMERVDPIDGPSVAELC